MHLNIFVSQRCFVSCKGCYSFSRNENFNQELDTKTIVDFLKYAYFRGIKKVTLCGGDPLTRKDIVNLLKQIKNIGMFITLDTVGTTLIRDVKCGNNIIYNKVDIHKIAELVDTIGIPFDGSSNEIFKKFRQTNFDLFSDQLEIIQQLIKNNANICINTVVHKGNLNDSKSLCEIINQLDGINKWQLFKFIPIGKYGSLNKNFFDITDEEFNNYEKEILEKSNKSDIIEFKGMEVRNKLYMLIDNSGNAWVSDYSQELLNDYNSDFYNRNIVGNITRRSDWTKICNVIKGGKSK